MKLLIVVNSPDFFLSHRLPLALAAREAGFDVHIATGPGQAGKEIAACGLTHHAIALTRSGLSPVQEVKSLWALYRLMRRLRPDLVHLVTIKPVLYGGLMARLAGVPAVVAAISGLGTVFVDSGGLRAWLRRGIERLYRLALGHPNIKVIVQNPDDRAWLLEMRVVDEADINLIKGSGVRLEDYPLCPEPGGVPVVTMAARLLKDKGVVEFVEAARLLKSRGANARFWLAGAPDPDNPTSVTEDEVSAWGKVGLIEPLGFRKDVAAVFARSHLIVLPSYREGLPKVLIEAAACGRAVVTTDTPGCRDAIVPGETGLLVPPRDAPALADAIQSLLENPERRRQMGAAGRRLAEREYGIDQVIAAHLAIYRALTS